MKSLLLITLSILAFQAHAQDRYVCKSDHSEHVIEVVYTNPNSKVPCEVRYTKPDGTAVLWDAKHEVGYCEAKAKTFAEKLTSLGMSCSGVDEASSTAVATEQPSEVQAQQDAAPAPLVDTPTSSTLESTNTAPVVESQTHSDSPTATQIQQDAAAPLVDTPASSTPASATEASTTEAATPSQAE
ncbi:hypothetical protein SKA34_09453 [Photobacterium sp. SKA34]|nr:hypothetical protein SKA34_09453 [Photobacterium sp. SKA34]